jgi:soluble lytic murein transglycosylase-like protein
MRWGQIAGVAGVAWLVFRPGKTPVIESRTITRRDGNTLRYVAPAGQIDYAGEFSKALDQIFNAGRELMTDKTPTARPTPAQPTGTGTVRQVPGWVPPPTAVPFLDMLNNAADLHGVPPALLVAQAWKESRFDPTAHNKKSNAQGIMQIVPYGYSKKTGQFTNPVHPSMQGKTFTPALAIDYAAKYDAWLNRQFAGSWSKTLAAYNWGIGNLHNLIATRGDDWFVYLPRETRDYVADIMTKAGLKI